MKLMVNEFTLVPVAWGKQEDEPGDFGPSRGARLKPWSESRASAEHSTWMTRTGQLELARRHHDGQPLPRSMALSGHPVASSLGETSSALAHTSAQPACWPIRLHSSVKCSPWCSSRGWAAPRAST